MIRYNSRVCRRALVRAFFRNTIRGGSNGVSLLILIGITIVAAGLAQPASASLRIQGKGHHAALWQRVYEQMPCCWKTDRSVSVQELSEAEMAAFVAARGGPTRIRHANKPETVDGCYEKCCNRNGDAAIIRVCSCDSEQKAVLVFAHEYAHFVWGEKLTKAQRAGYGRVWKQQRQAGLLVTVYAAESAEEGFAEAAAYFLYQSGLLRQRDGASYEFVSGLLPQEPPRTEAPAPIPVGQPSR